MKIEEEIKQNKFTSSTQKALLNLMFTANWLTTIYRDTFKPFKITQQQYNVLRILRGRYPNAANPSEIKEVMLDKNPDLTRLCDRMCASGWIHREINETNRRKMNIKITEKGLKLLEKMDPIISKAEEKLAYFSTQDCENLSDLLDKMRG